MKPVMPRQEIPEKLARMVQRLQDELRRDPFYGACATSRGTDDLIELNIGNLADWGDQERARDRWYRVFWPRTWFLQRREKCLNSNH